MLAVLGSSGVGTAYQTLKLQMQLPWSQPSWIGSHTGKHPQMVQGHLLAPYRLAASAQLCPSPLSGSCRTPIKSMMLPLCMDMLQQCTRHGTIPAQLLIVYAASDDAATGYHCKFQGNGNVHCMGLGHVMEGFIGAKLGQDKGCPAYCNTTCG